MNERDARFFRPLWLRVGITAGLVVWCGLESIFSHDGMWITITAIGVIYCVWNFFLRFPKDVPPQAQPAAPSDTPPPPTQP